MPDLAQGETPAPAADFMLDREYVATVLATLNQTARLSGFAEAGKLSSSP